MDEGIKHLIELQDCDQRIHKLRTMIASVPGEKKQIQDELSGAEVAVEAAKLGIHEIDLKVKSLESDIGAVRERIATIRIKQLDVKKNDEYRALLKEIENCEGKIRGIEDQELEYWEQREAGAERLAEANKALAASNGRIVSALDDLDTRRKSCEFQVEKLLEKRKEHVVKVLPELLVQYEGLCEIKRRRGGGFMPSVVPLNDENCGGCHMKVTPQVRIIVRANKVVPCENCSSLLHNG
ncbi:MAG: putative nucleic acid-binding Zn-ribbon protein [Rhodothermales bacterium]|jgi:predicted  nucleic acid-binding Zn-ribbon protein